MDMSPNIDRNSPVFDIFVTGLKNTHAVEMQALQIMERQLDRLENYPEMAAALRRHVEETHMQRQRLEEAMSYYGESPSAMKEGFLGIVGNMAALAHAPAQDEILKNSFANQAFENYEIAAYESLLEMCHTIGHTQTQPFETSLSEEERMAQEVRALIRPTTRRYIQLTTSGGQASH